MSGTIVSASRLTGLRRVLPTLAFAAASVIGTAAMACPDWSMTGQQLNYSSDQLWTAQSLSVVAGGANNLSNCPQPGVGYVASRPDFDLSFSGNSMGRDLDFRVTADCDTVLLVNDARGQWYFNDDGGEGLNARLRVPSAPNGAYDIWVGTYGPSTCRATLTLETFGGGSVGGVVTPPPAQALCPDPGQNGRMLSYDGQALYTAQRFDVIAGGNVDLARCQAVPGRGYLMQSPDYTLNLAGNPQQYDLEFRTEGSCDPVLLVHDSSGQWHFNDDSAGLNARLRLDRARPGEYDIWVGTYGPQTCQAMLVAESFGGVAPQPQPPAGVTAAPSTMTGYRGQNGQTFSFQVTGASSGSVWGTGIYTDDSSVARAAVHAGLVGVGQTGVVHVQVLPGQQSYQGSAQYGVQSSNYGTWHGSYQFVRGGGVAGGVAGGGQMVEAQGRWAIVANGYAGRLELDQRGGVWSGTVYFDAHGGRAEPLMHVGYDAGSGTVTFTRPLGGATNPLGGATQIYRGTLRGDQISGQFNQGGGAYTYEWTATRTGGAAAAPGGGLGK
ncbi:LCCL domain-containing protein [Pararhodobacter sp.]|uniref:LCCL domain-containing protein n=1 Tax=Pararhodobacter sp. TaxID=2127056 RepID=UPI002AFE3739|nr:LCCL domain-containing protein [Pararhodobacter sp.]